MRVSANATTATSAWSSARLSTLLVPSAGTASIDGHDVVADYAVVRRLLGYMPESYMLDHRSASRFRSLAMRASSRVLGKAVSDTARTRA